MNGLNKIEQYLIELKIEYQEIATGTFLINDRSRGLVQVVAAYDDPIVIVRAKAMEVPKERKLELFETLLRLNADDLTHGAYAIEKNEVILVDTLEYATMDRTEFEASLDSLGFALGKHYTTLGAYRS
ncbi:MAG: YbjN domain-containing protein [Spirochaetes bacterium]|nr:YbjN domain-containing protein [Spirochaetota bacterium]